MESPQILVTGATGGVGGAAVKWLESQGHRVAGLARDPRRATFTTVRQGDYEDVDSLVNALEGIDTLAFVSSDGDPVVMSRHHENMRRAVERSEVHRVLYTGILDMDPESPFVYQPVHRDTEAWVLGGSWSGCSLRTSVFTEFFNSLIDRARIGEVTRLPAEGKISVVDRISVGHSLARLALAATWERTIEYATGPVAQSIEALAAKTGVRLEPITVETYRESLGRAGEPEWLVAALGSFFESIARGGFAHVA